MGNFIVICQGCETEMTDYDEVMFKHEAPYCKTCGGYDE